MLFAVLFVVPFAAVENLGQQAGWGIVPLPLKRENNGFQLLYGAGVPGGAESF